ncbi:MAG: hypothetical protein II916_03185 [Oscillospiraceae bacterium]|nr:hypothetical protein [Oscillospiraceae bacterium]
MNSEKIKNAKSYKGGNVTILAILGVGKSFWLTICNNAKSIKNAKSYKGGNVAILAILGVGKSFALMVSILPMIRQSGSGFRRDSIPSIELRSREASYCAVSCKRLSSAFSQVFASIAIPPEMIKK